MQTDEEGDESVSFHRSFDKDGKEEYGMNGQKLSAKAYIERIRKFHIQVDNLCMFLPQDRVQDFTKLNPQELLQSTQISVCDEKVNEAFASLKKKREQQKSAAKHNAEIQVKLNDNTSRNEQLHAMIENNRTKEKLIEQRVLHQKKKVWLEYDALKAKLDETLGESKVLENGLIKKKSELKPLEKKQQEIAGEKTKLKNDIMTSTNTQSTITSSTDRLIREAEKFNSEIRQSKQEIANLIQSSRDHEREVEDLRLKVRLDRAEYAKAKQELDESQNDAVISELDQKMGAIQQRVESLMVKRREVSDDIGENIVHHKRSLIRKIGQMKDSQGLRFQTLHNHFEDAWKASEWLKNNRNQFKGHIFNPILTEISVTNKNYAKYVENCVGFRDLQTFLCTDKADMSKLIKILRNDQRLNVNVGYTEATDDLNFAPPRDINEFPKEYGVFAYLIDMIDGPAPVLNYLCKLYGLHNIIVARDSIENYASRLPADIRVFFSSTSRFSVTVSRYTGNKSVQSNEISPRNIVDVGIDEEELRKEEAKLQNLNQREENLTVQRTQYERQISDLNAQRNEVNIKIVTN